MKGLLYINISIVATVRVDVDEDGVKVGEIEFANSPQSCMLIDHSSEFKDMATDEVKRRLNLVCTDLIIEKMHKATQEHVRDLVEYEREPIYIMPPPQGKPS